MVYIIGNNFKNTWDEITLAEFFLLDEIRTNTNLSLVERNLQTLAVLSGKNQSDFLKFNNEEIKEVLDKELNFLKTEITGDLQDYYTIAGKKYKLIKNLDEFTAGQFIDLMTYTKDKSLIMDNLHLTLTVFLIPTIDLSPKETLFNKAYEYLTRYKIGQRLAQKWHIKPYEEKPENYLQTPASVSSEIFYNHFKISDAVALSVFFCLLGTLYAVTTKHYLLEKLEKQLSLASKTLENQPMTPEIQNLLNQMDTLKNGLGSSVSIT